MLKRGRFEVLFALVAALVVAPGCSKNESASSACSAMTDTETCSACCTKNGANGYKYASGSACSCLGGEDSKAGAPPAKAPPAGAISFAGNYRSNWGPTAFAQDGSRVTATYARGSMTCQASGANLDCDWHEGTLAGKAKLAKQGDGSIRGTWGNGASATDGGAWTFTP